MKYLHITDGWDWLLTTGQKHWVQRVPPLLTDLGFACEPAVVSGEQPMRMSQLVSDLRERGLPRDFDFVSIHAGAFDLLAPTPESERAESFNQILDLACAYARDEP